jgi:hypothetical protein
MSNLANLKSKVNARVAEKLVPVLFERAVRVHEKRAWRDCPCDWCQRKREWHSRLQFAPHSPPSIHALNARDRRALWRYNTVQFARRELAEEEQRILS